MTDDEVAKLVRILVRSGHHSALEHASFSFAVDGVSRACTHQLVRHRVASYNQQSQRYVNFSAADSFVVPPSIAANAEAEAVFLKAMDDARAAYDRLVELGLAEGRGKESVQEDARFVLPNAAETKIVVTMNARELRHFFQVRCCRRAQWEINALAWQMRGIVKRALAAPVRRQRSRLSLRHLPRGQDDLRPALQGRRGRRPGGVTGLSAFAARRPRRAAATARRRPAAHGRRPGRPRGRHDARRRQLVPRRAQARRRASGSSRGRSPR